MAVKVKHGITEKKKAKLDALAKEVLQAQFEVDQFQAIVTSMTEKSAACHDVLAYSDSRRTQCLDNKTAMDQLQQMLLKLKDSSHRSYTATKLADSKTEDMVKLVKQVTEKLIYSAEIVNKLGNIVIRKKALNPLISDDLVSRVTSAGNDANNAVALTLIALRSAFVAQASNMESEAVAALLSTQSSAIIKRVGAEDKSKKNDLHLMGLITNAYENAKLQYDHAQQAVNEIQGQLSQAGASLSKAQVKLKGLQAALAAGNAAALAN